jgi:type IV secretion system protein VirB5
MENPMKYSLKQLRVISAALAVGVALSAHAQGIPTIDGTSIAQRVLLIENTIEQLQQMKTQVQMLSGNLGVGLIMNSPQLRAYLPDQWEQIYQNSQNGNLQGLTGATTSIMQQEGLLNAANAPTSGQQRINATLASNKAMAQQAYDASIQRLTNIVNLLQQSNLTQSASQKADIQNRLQGELAMVQNEQTRLNLMTTLQKAESDLAERQQQQTFKNAILGRDANGNTLPVDSNGNVISSGSAGSASGGAAATSATQ